MSFPVLAAATRLQKKYTEVPKLDLRVKRKQITHLLNELTRDAKMSFIKERSNRDELLAEIIHSLVSWLNDIWSVVYENHVNFLLAHMCLLFVADALVQLAEVSILGQYVVYCTLFDFFSPILLDASARS